VTRLGDLVRYGKRDSSVGFWYLPIQPAAELDAAALGPYPLDLTAKADYAGPFDEKGVPLLNYYGSVGLQRNPCAVAQYGLGWHGRWRTGAGEAARAHFLAQADWLAANLVSGPGGVRAWQYGFTANAGAYPVRIPWISALAQGQGISALLRAGELTGESRYTDAAREAFGAFLKPVAEGGLQASLAGGVFFEEVPSDPPSFILDGFLFSLFGVRDYLLVTGDPAAGPLLEQALDTAESCLPLFDAGFWSRGDLFRRAPPMLASPLYHRIHVLQLDALFALTGRPAFQLYADRWRGFLANPVYRAAAIAGKSLFKLLYY
jgi:heparosan-N-sulfate-glucuronate 5-epimerase